MTKKAFGLFTFRAGTVGLVAFAFLRTVAAFSDFGAVLSRDADREVWRMVVAHRFEVRGRSATLADMLHAYGLFLMIAAWWQALANLVFLWFGRREPRVLAAAATLDALTLIALAAAAYRVFGYSPTLLGFGFFAALFAVSAVALRLDGPAA